MVRFISSIVCMALSVATFAQTNPTNELLKKADAIRNPADTYEMQIKVETQEGESTFQVYMKGQDKTLIVTKEPARDRGRNMLMLDRDFHAYVPNLKRSMRLSLAQKLSGQVANGDISRTRWYGDYEAQQESETKDEVQLFLTGSKKNLTYANIRLWLSKKDYRPLKAEYLALNGKTILKKAYFEDYRNLAGASRPGVLRIEDSNGQASKILIQSMQAKTLNDAFFTVRNMESLK